MTQLGQWEQLRCLNLSVGFPGGSDGKASARNAGDPGSIPGLGRSPGESLSVQSGREMPYPLYQLTIVA